MKIKSILLTVTAMFFLAGNSALAAPLTVTSYDMLNGNTGTYKYFDGNYSGSGNKQGINAPLTGGTGALTDGVVATLNWQNVSNSAGTGQYVGWTLNPTITFHFGKDVTISSITFNVDDSNGTGGVSAPLAFKIGSTTYNVADPAGSAPFAYTITGNFGPAESIAVEIQRRTGWVMVSEVTFNGTAPAVPVPAAAWLLGSGLLSLFAVRRKTGK